jgi:hypothetical protein
MVKVTEIAGTAKKKSRILVKVYTLIILTAVAAFLSSFLFERGKFFSGIVALVIFLTLFVIQQLIIDKKTQLYIYAPIYIICLATPFFKLFSTFFIFVVIVSCGFFINAVYRGRKLIDNMIKLQLFRAARTITESALISIIIFFTATAILISDYSISQKRIDQIVELAISPIMKRYIPDFQIDTTMESIFLSLAETRAKEDARFKLLTPTIQKQIINETFLEIQNNMENLVGVELETKQSVSKNIYDIVKTKLDEISSTAKMWFSVMLIVLVALTVKSIEIIIYIPFSLLIFLVYELLHSLGFFIVQLETRSKEIISLK